MIFAGYPTEMSHFLECNPGLLRRITNHFKFENYTHLQLIQIWRSMAGKAGFVVDIDDRVAESRMAQSFDEVICSRYNAGLSKELLNACKSSIDSRLSQQLGGPVLSLRSEIMKITLQDFVMACDKVKRKLCPSVH